MFEKRLISLPNQCRKYHRVEQIFHFHPESIWNENVFNISEIMNIRKRKLPFQKIILASKSWRPYKPFHLTAALDSIQQIDITICKLVFFILHANNDEFYWKNEFGVHTYLTTKSWWTSSSDMKIYGILPWIYDKSCIFSKKFTYCLSCVVEYSIFE